MEKFEQLAKSLRQKPARWLVTGAAGFIGSHLVENLLRLGQQVVGVDNFFTGHKKNVEIFTADSTYAKNYEFIEGDIVDRKLCVAVTKNVNYVLHQAAVGSVPRSIEDPLTSHRANVDGFIEILKAAVDNKVKKFVYASSSSVYGDNPQLPKVETGTGAPLSPYAATKLIDEIYASVFQRVYDTSVTGLRYFNVFGPRQDPHGPYAAVIPLWIDSMIEGKPVYINGDGSFSRDFCYVDNVVQANLLAALSDANSKGQVYNVAYGERTTLLELFQILREGLMKIDPQLKINDVVHREFRQGDIPHSLADISKAKKDLGYAPKVQVKPGAFCTVEYFYKKHKEHR